MPTSTSIWSNESEYRMIASQDKHLWSLFKWGEGTELYSSHEKYFIQAKINRFSWNCPLSWEKFTQGALQFHKTGQKSLGLQKLTTHVEKLTQQTESSQNVTHVHEWLGRNGSSGQRWRLNGWQRIKAAISDPAWRLCIYWQCIVKADRCISTTTITKTSTILFIQTTITKTNTIFIIVLFIALPYSMPSLGSSPTSLPFVLT